MEDGVNNYLLVTYKNRPNIEYICDSKGEIRIKVSKISERLLKLIPSDRIYARSQNCLYLFDDAGSKVQSISDFTPAIEWYKKYSDEDEMRIVVPQVK